MPIWIAKSRVRSWRNPRAVYYVSTVKLAYTFSSYKYETMVFLDGVDFTDLDGTRYQTVEDAMAGHIAYVRRARFGRVGYEYGTPKGARGEG